MTAFHTICNEDFVDCITVVIILLQFTSLHTIDGIVNGRDTWGAPPLGLWYDVYFIGGATDGLCWSMVDAIDNRLEP